MDIQVEMSEKAKPTPASRITRLRDGKFIAVNCVLNYSEPVTIDKAIDKVKAGKVAFVAREDAKKVLEEANKLLF